MVKDSDQFQVDSDGRILAWLKDYFNSRLDYERQIVDERDKRYMSIFENTEKAVIVALESINKRLDLLNESRSVISDMVANNPTRIEIQTNFDNVGKELKDINARLDRGEGSGAGKSAIWGYIVGGVGLILVLLTIAQKLVGK